MGMQVLTASPAPTASADGGPPPKVAHPKSVSMTMAWELDCVACDVVPLDETHVAVLGLVPAAPGDADDPGAPAAGARDGAVAGGDNALELQIVHRADGTAMVADRLPLAEGTGRRRTTRGLTPADATEFRLLSSYACPRMDDSAEWDALDDGDKLAVGRENSHLRSSSSMKQRFAPHLRWKLDEDICSVGNEIHSEAAHYDDQTASSECSVCSDNYVFVQSEPEIMNNAAGDILPDALLPARPVPPIMAAVYSYDLCLVQTRDVDDAISYALSLGKPSLALKQALTHRRDVRRHGLVSPCSSLNFLFGKARIFVANLSVALLLALSQDQLVDEYFVSLLRMRAFQKDKLSFSRLKIAAGSVPILLGGDARMWQRWIFLFSNIPGAIWVIREKIPVRDPILPAFVFEMSLERMTEEILSNSSERGYDVSKAKDHQNEENLGDKMADLFLETLRSWGPTSAIRRWIQLHRYCAQNRQWGLQWHSPLGSSALIPFIRQAEKDLHRRISQTAFGVLVDGQRSSSSAQNSSMRQYVDSSEDSLFNVEKLISRLAARLQPDVTDGFADRESSNIFIGGNMESNHAVIIESMAELEMMRERFDRALGYYLTIGSLFMANLLPSIEASALLTVNSFCQHTEQTRFDSIKYSHVLALVELHQLSHILLKRNFFYDNEVDDSTIQSPIVALIMIVGLSRAGRFLMDNCSPPQGTVTPATAVEKGGSSSSLPFDMVAKQLKSRPKLLYWYLFQVFLHKPDMYMKFPTTTVPPPAITDLHRMQFQLFVDYANQDDTIHRESTGLMSKDTPFMAFLRVSVSCV